MNETISGSGQVKYILVMDSDVNERFTLSMLLQRFGYTVCSAGNAREAVEFLCVAASVAVFAEAGNAGTDLLKQLGGDARFKEVPLVLVAESADRGLEDSVRRGELAGVLRKPLNPDEVFLVIQEVIEKGTRRNIRISTSLPAVVMDGLAETQGHISVLSQYGLFFRTLESRPQGSRIVVEFALWGKVVRLEATVLYVVSFEEGPFREPGMGMKFVKIAPEDSGLIKAFIYEYLFDGIAPLDPSMGYRGGLA